MIAAETMLVGVRRAVIGMGWFIWRSADRIHMKSYGIKALAFGKQGKKERSRKEGSLARRRLVWADTFVPSYLCALPAKGGR